MRSALRYDAENGDDKAVIAFRPLVQDDLPLLHTWLQQSHVKRWWRDRDTLEDVEAHYLPAILGIEPTDHYVVELDGRAIGMLQTYRATDYAADWPVGARPGDAGVDILIGEPEFVGRGLGPQILRLFVDEIVFADAGVNAVIAGPDVRNTSSIRAFEKAGFRRLREVAVPGEEAAELLMQFDRTSP